MRRILVSIALALLIIGLATYSYATESVADNEAEVFPMTVSLEDNTEKTVKEPVHPAAEDGPDEPKEDTTVSDRHQPDARKLSAPVERKEVAKNLLDNLVLVNKNNPLPPDYVPPDLAIPDMPFVFPENLPQRYLRKEAAQALSQLYEKAAQEGIEIVGVSGYRSYQRQDEIFTARAKERGEMEANRTSAYPGQSEHQTGLAVDISSPVVGCQLTQDFGDTTEGRWLSENAPEFGFIIRYQKGEENITGYAYEPWHLRYVGKDAARTIAQRNLTLEEYLG